jgi:demethylmenaquinone methyltransferase/2-methoxy-6-polyprenyl-1,4-benzoquinol methylase
MTGQDNVDVARRVFLENGDSYADIANYCTIGLDKYWKRRIMAALPPAPRSLIDQACGTGILTLEIAQKFPDCRVVGVDLVADYLDIAKARAAALGLTNVEFLHGPAEDVVVDGGFDCITSSYLAKYCQLDRLIENAAAMLTPGGKLVMHDFALPRHPIYRGLWELHMKYLKVFGPISYPQWKTAFEEVPVVIRGSNWVDRLCGALAANGFVDVETRWLAFEGAALVTGRKGA